MIHGPRMLGMPELTSGWPSFTPPCANHDVHQQDELKAGACRKPVKGANDRLRRRTHDIVEALQPRDPVVNVFTRYEPLGLGEVLSGTKGLFACSGEYDRADVVAAACVLQDLAHSVAQIGGPGIVALRSIQPDDQDVAAEFGDEAVAHCDLDAFLVLV